MTGHQSAALVTEGDTTADDTCTGFSTKLADPPGVHVSPTAYFSQSDSSDSTGDNGDDTERREEILLGGDPEEL